MWFRAGRVGVAWRLPLRSSSPVSYVSSIRDLRYTLAQDGGIRLFSSDTMTRHRIEKITADLFPNDPRTEEVGVQDRWITSMSTGRGVRSLVSDVILFFFLFVCLFDCLYSCTCVYDLLVGATLCRFGRVRADTSFPVS